jgi:hypothetical protein
MFSISTLVTAIFTTSSVKMTLRVGARPSTRSSPKIACSTSQVASTVAATRSIASRAQSRLLTLTFDISQLPSPRNWAMAGGSNGYRAALVRRQLTPGLISSLPGTAGLPPFISFSTSYRCRQWLDPLVDRRPIPADAFSRVVTGLQTQSTVFHAARGVLQRCRK